MCGILVLVATISFLMDPKDTNRGVLLATVLLVLATFFTVAHVNEIIFRTISILKNKYSSNLHTGRSIWNRLHCFNNLHFDLYGIYLHKHILLWNIIVHIA